MNNVLLNNFLDLCKIPHTSGNEEKLRNYLKLRFENGGIKAKIDKVGNLYAHTPATKGYEKRPTICLQAHLDMVGSKTKKSKHNFKTDPIQVSIKNGILKANNTTLGGDDGGGVAMIVTVLEDKQIQHGPLEALFTIEEETTTIGAIKLEKNVLQAKYLFNIDGEGDDTITIGSGGGEDIECYIKPKLVTTKGQTVLISLFKLLSGHSGGDIHLNRLNAIIEVFKCLNKLSNKYEIQLCNAQGGMAKNVIPGFCDIYVNVNDNQAKNFINDAKKYLINLKKINRKNEPNLEFKVTLTKTRNKAINTKDTNKIVDFISNVTNGKIKYDKKYKVVSESANLGIIKFDNGSLTLE
jgi:dipeptidase D